MATPFHAELVTPERVLFSGDVDEVSMRTDAGEISFLAAHEDYVAAADITVVRLSVIGGRPAGSGQGSQAGSQAGSGAGSGAGAGATGGASRPASASPGATVARAKGPAAPSRPAARASAPGGPHVEGSGEALLAAVHGGFVQVDGDGVVILASVAELAGEIDVARARRALEAAEQGQAAGAAGSAGASDGSGSGAGAAPGAGTTGAGTTPLRAGLPGGAAGAGGPAVPGQHGLPAAPGPDGLPAAPGLANPSPAMLALLEPDAPGVRARRARARLEAAGAR